MIMLECQNLSVVLLNKLLFEPISIRVNAGECHQLLGENGSGKTTCLKAMAGIIQSEGKLNSTTSSYLGHETGLYEDLKVGELISWWQAINKTPIPYPALPNIKIRDLSAGQKQQLAWLRLQSEQSKLWLLDEPLTHLDQNIRFKLLSVIQAHMSNGGAIIITSHLSEPWQKIVTHKHRIEIC